MDAHLKLAPTVQLQDQFEFLPGALEVLESPPAPFGRMIAGTIAAFFVLGIIWAWWGLVDVVIIAQGQIVPTGQVKVVQPLETGVVKAIHVQEGQAVHAGELLIELDPTESTANIDTLNFDLQQAQLDAAAGAALLAQDPAKHLTAPQDIAAQLIDTTRTLLTDELNLHQATLAGIAAQIDNAKATIRVAAIEQWKLEQTLPLIKEQLADQESLLAAGIAQKPMVLSLRQQALEQQAALNNTIENRSRSKADIAALEARRIELVANFRFQAGQRRQEALRKMATIEQALKKEQQRQHYRQLTAPVAGHVHQLMVHTVGAVVNSAQQLLTIVPDHAPLQLETMILNKDIGFVSIGQEVAIKLEAFPFTRYGTLAGRMLSLSDDAIIDESLGPVYKARITLDQQAIVIDGQTIALSPGMSALAEVKTDQRRIIDFFISPVLRYRDEAFRER